MKTKRYHLSQDQKSTLKEKIKQVLDEDCKEADAVYLFGSFAGNSRFSDIDIGLLLKEVPSDPTEYELNLETNLERKIQYPCDIRILNAAPPGFCYEVISTGQLLVDKNPNLRADFEGYMLKKHLDFQYFRKRYLSEVLHAPL